MSFVGVDVQSTLLSLSLQLASGYVQILTRSTFMSTCFCMFHTVDTEKDLLLR